MQSRAWQCLPRRRGAVDEIAVTESLRVLGEPTRDFPRARGGELNEAAVSDVLPAFVEGSEDDILRLETLESFWRSHEVKRWWWVGSTVNVVTSDLSDMLDRRFSSNVSSFCSEGWTVDFTTMTLKTESVTLPLGFSPSMTHVVENNAEDDQMNMTVVRSADTIVWQIAPYTTKQWALVDDRLLLVFEGMLDEWRETQSSVVSWKLGDHTISVFPSLTRLWEVSWSSLSALRFMLMRTVVAESDVAVEGDQVSMRVVDCENIFMSLGEHALVGQSTTQLLARVQSQDQVDLEGLKSEEVIEIVSLPFVDPRRFAFHPQTQHEILLENVWVPLSSLNEWLLDNGEKLFLFGEWTPVRFRGGVIDNRPFWLRRKNEMPLLLIASGVPMSLSRKVLTESGDSFFATCTGIVSCDLNPLAVQRTWNGDRCDNDVCAFFSLGKQKFENVAHPARFKKNRDQPIATINEHSIEKGGPAYKYKFPVCV